MTAVAPDLPRVPLLLQCLAPRAFSMGMTDFFAAGWPQAAAMRLAGAFLSAAMGLAEAAVGGMASATDRRAVGSNTGAE